MILMQRRRILTILQETAELPEGYQEVEYLTSADNKANRYINTQVATESVKTIVLAYEKESARAAIIVCNNDGSGLTTPFGSLNNYSGYGFLCSPFVDLLDLCPKTDFTFTKTRAGTGNLCLMGWVNSSYVSKGKLFSASLFDNNNVKLGEFVPCYRKADNAIGLYDIVNNRFCQQTGGIGKGPDVT